MTRQEQTLAQLGAALSQLARPHRCDETLPRHVQATLKQLGMPSDELTPRDVLIAELWARKRVLSAAFQTNTANHDWPPSAA